MAKNHGQLSDRLETPKRVNLHGTDTKQNLTEQFFKKDIRIEIKARRSRIMRASEFAYTFIGPKFVCAYCGDPADTVDHTVPSWFVAGNPRLINEHQLFKVAACSDCNHRAGAGVDKTFIQRKRRIAASIRGKH